MISFVNAWFASSTLDRTYIVNAWFASSTHDRHVTHVFHSTILKFSSTYQIIRRNSVEWYYRRMTFRFPLAEHWSSYYCELICLRNKHWLLLQSNLSTSISKIWCDSSLTSEDWTSKIEDWRFLWRDIYFQFETLLSNQTFCKQFLCC
jgi:hypothetical protein